MRRSLLWSIATAGACTAFAVVPAASLAASSPTIGNSWVSAAVVGGEGTFTTLATGPAPRIDSVSISHLTPTDATLEAQVDTEGLPTEYQFDLTSSPCSKHGAGCELLIAIPLPSGKLLGSFVDQTVSLDLNSAGVRLGQGEYHYSVTATSAGGSTEANGQTFEAPSGVYEPLGPATAPQSGGAQAPASSNSGQSAGSGATSGFGASSSTASPDQASNPLSVSRTDAPKRGAKHKRKAERIRHRPKAARHHARVKKHKR